MNNLNYIISILFGVGLFVVYYNMIQNRQDINKTLTDNLKKQRRHTDRLLTYSKGNVKYENKKHRTNNTRNIAEKQHIANNITNDTIDHTRIYKKIDNSKYIMPLDNNLYNDNGVDPRTGPLCHSPLNCDAKKSYDLLITDDYDSFDVFNSNCTRDISSYSQETNNYKIDKALLMEDPSIYDNITRNI